MKNMTSRSFAGTKSLILVPVIALLAAGCGSSSTVNNEEQNSNQSSISMPSPTPTMAMDQNKDSMQMDNNSSGWQGTLQTSNSAAKGKYMITVSGHTVYIKTSRDYSTLVGKEVTVSYSGDMDSFTLKDIVAK